MEWSKRSKLISVFTTVFLPFRGGNTVGFASPILLLFNLESFMYSYA